MSDFFPTSASSTRWLTEEVFKLIEFVQSDEAIYNPRHKYYFCRPYVENFWREVDQKLDKNPGASLAKWTNLRISFRREFTNYLEEHVPPCWSYFDRMFFLHPYLRKKQQPTSKNGEATLQETLVQISELSNRLERRVARDLKKPESSTGATQDNANETRIGTAHSTQSTNEVLLAPLGNSDHYFDYYDEPEPNNSELDDMIDDEQQHEVSTRYPQVILETPGGTYNKIKSECEDEVQDQDFEQLPEIQQDVDTESIGATDEILIRGSVNSSAATSTTSTLTSRLGKRSQHQLRLEHLNRLQTRSYHEDLRSKRSRSQERTMSNTQSVPVSTVVNSNSHGQKNFCANTSSNALSNVSFVRPTLSKAAEALGILGNHTPTNDGNVPSTSSSSMALAAAHQQQSSTQQQLSRHYPQHSQRLEALNNSTTGALNAVGNTGNCSTAQATRQLLSPSSATALTPHMELCDCKTDPDAMFLMSLLPDIQKLNGRDRGKIKIAFQNILQDYLYPD